MRLIRRQGIPDARTKRARRGYPGVMRGRQLLAPGGFNALSLECPEA
jgi:hypothetical protein